MKGYKIEIGRNDACSFKYFTELGKALEWLKHSIEVEAVELKQRVFNIEIKELELKNCASHSCKNLIELDEHFCLFCESAYDDAYSEQKAEKEEIKKLEGD